jgi:hypothetical protein
VRAAVAGALIGIACGGPARGAPLDAVNAAIERGDHENAVRLLRPLAERGDADAQFRLGFMYQLGKGVAVNDPEAAVWYRKAALQAHAEARYRLGMMYASGIGVSRNAAEASRWLRLAAHQGHAPAQLELGLVYAAGVGVKRDDVQAHAWFEISMARFGAGDLVNRTHAQRERDAVALRLTPEQLAEAHRLASEFRPTNQ